MAPSYAVKTVHSPPFSINVSVQSLTLHSLLPPLSLNFSQRRERFSAEMAKSFSVLLPLLLLLLVTVSFVESYGVRKLRPSDCAGRCAYRCSGTSHRKPCMFFCQKCCAQCLCVPPGTYGNKQMCPCYNNWKTKEGGPKCP